MADIKVTIIDREGQTHELEGPTDMNMNVMELCKAYDLPVKGECGGMAMCASCQVYVVEGSEKLVEMGDEEDAMLSEAFHVQDNSRLGCQIHITEEIDGLEVAIAPYP